MGRLKGSKDKVQRVRRTRQQIEESKQNVVPGNPVTEQKLEEKED